MISIFLGRKCCIPSKPVYVSTCDTKDQLNAILEKNGKTDISRIISEIDRNGVLENDVPRDYKSREFTSRMVSEDSTEWL